MMTLAEIPHMIERLEAGELDLRDVCSLCLELFAHDDVEVVIEQLPARVREALVAEWRAMYASEAPAGHFFLRAATTLQKRERAAPLDG